MARNNENSTRISARKVRKISRTSDTIADDAVPEAVLVSPLLDMEGSNLLCILAFLDEQSLTRVSATCAALLPLAQTSNLWKAALVRFFDGELPPALANCEDDARAILREQVDFARALITRERTVRCFQVPIVPFPERMNWMREVDNRVAETRRLLPRPVFA